MPYFDQPAVVIDLETTGANPTLDRITEVGLIEISGGALVREWASLVNPQAPIPPFIASMTGITNAMVRAAPTFEEIAQDLRTRLAGRIFIAHNARFDYGFLKHAFQRMGLDFDAPVLCTVKLSRRLWPQHRSHGLDAIMARHGIVCAGRHRALGDARALWAFLRHVRVALPTPQVEAAIAEVLHHDMGMPVASPVDPEAVPDTHGVYRFYDAGGALLYVGKSDDMRARVRAHFATGAGSKRDAQLARAVRRVDWIATAGEFGTALLAARCIEQDAPRHNRAAGRSTARWTLQLSEDATPARASTRIVETSAIDVRNLGQCFGLFREPRAAELALRALAKAHGLCHRLLGWDEGSGACSARRSSACRGACVGSERAEVHHLRLLAALAPLRLQPWPYRGRIGVRERERDTGRTVIHLVDHWCVLGSAACEDDVYTLAAQRSALVFDAEHYRLLVRMLASPHPGLDVIELPVA